MKVLHLSLLCFILLTSIVPSSRALTADVSSFQFASNSVKLTKWTGEIVRLAASSDEVNQIASFRTFENKEDAERFGRELNNEGFQVEISMDIKDKKTVYTVFARKPEAVMTATEFKLNQKLSTDQRDKIQGNRIQPPLILTPVERAEFRNKYKIAFMWSDITAAAGYHFLLARDRMFKNIIHENAKITDTFYTVENLDYGTYFFKISSLRADGAEGPFSETQTFVIVPQQPVGVHFK